MIRHALTPEFIQFYIAAADTLPFPRYMTEYWHRQIDQLRDVSHTSQQWQHALAFSTVIRDLFAAPSPAKPPRSTRHRLTIDN